MEENTGSRHNVIHVNDVERKYLDSTLGVGVYDAIVFIVKHPLSTISQNIRDSFEIDSKLYTETFGDVIRPGIRFQYTFHTEKGPTEDLIISLAYSWKHGSSIITSKFNIVFLDIVEILRGAKRGWASRVGSDPHQYEGFTSKIVEAFMKDCGVLKIRRK